MKTMSTMRVNIKRWCSMVRLFLLAVLLGLAGLPAAHAQTVANFKAKT